MSFQYPPAEPQSLNYMRTADPESVQFEWFRIACHDFATWQRACGVTTPMQDVDQFVQPGDLQLFINVVSKWPEHPPHQLAKPTLGGMIYDIKLRERDNHTFRTRLDWHVDRIGAWMHSKRMDPQNPNETKEERAKRMNRERQRRWKLGHAEESDDPILNELIQEARALATELGIARAWLKDYVRDQKAVAEAAILAAKQARLDNVSAGESAVAALEKRMLEAKLKVDTYKSNN